MLEYNSFIVPSTTAKPVAPMEQAAFPLRPERRSPQAARVVAAMAAVSAEKKIIVGDLNVVPDTRSVHLIEAAGYRNLITEYAIADTRTAFYHKAPRLADYVFVSQAVRVEAFHVDHTPVSDHAALILSVR